MSYDFTYVRADLVPEALAGGQAYDVFDADRHNIGTITHVANARTPGWRVFYAGYGVPIDKRTMHRSRDHATVALLGHRTDAQGPGGALHVDETGLSGRDRAVLAFARQRFTSPGIRAAEIRAQFSISPTRFTVVLNTLINQPAAIAYDPLLCHRLQRIRDDRATRRTGGRLPADQIPQAAS